MENSKRRFLKGTCALFAGATGASLLATVNAAEGAKAESDIKYAMIHDETKCIGCRACEVACRETNQVPEGVSRVRIEQTGPFGEYPNP